MINVTFSTGYYRESHGRNPHANERGAWVFQEITGFREGDPIFVPGPKSLTQAKRYIQEMVAAEGESAGRTREFRVCP